MNQHGRALRQAGRAVVAALRDRRARRAAVAVAAAYLLVYLLAVGDVSISPASDLSRFVDLPSLQTAPDWTAKLLQRRAAFAYEPVLALYPINHVTVFVAPLDLAMGLLLGALAGLNLAVALLARRTSRACRLRGLPGLLGAVPALLTGVTCCVPTLALALGAQFTFALLAVSDWLFPLALAVTATSLLWSAQQARHCGERLHGAAAVASAIAVRVTRRAARPGRRAGSRPWFHRRSAQRCGPACRPAP
ncbi:MAG TPA: hypothetical protein VE776_14645 [Actinomycetota bacterium]|jgi:hypothetical protein|nr:hypothetical protein [Actinomycetota bacterium]